MFYALSTKIESVPLVASELQLKSIMAEIALLKKTLGVICRIILKHEKINHEDGRDFLSMDQWKQLFDKVKPEKFKEERGTIEKGRSFCTAYRTPMGEEIETCMLQSIQNGYEAINKCEISVGEIFEMNIYRANISLWNEKIAKYKANINRVKKIIYKGK